MQKSFTDNNVYFEMTELLTPQQLKARLATRTKQGNRRKPVMRESKFQQAAYRYKIGIDPGIKCGLARWDSKEERFDFITTYPLHTLLSVLEIQKTYDPIVYIEDPNTWIPFKRKRVDSARLQGAGAVKQTFKHIVEFLEAIKIPYQTIKLQGGLKKKDKIWFMQQTGWLGRTDEHGRDAAMLVWKRGENFKPNKAGHVSSSF